MICKMSRYKKITTTAAIFIFLFLAAVTITLPRSVVDPDLRMRSRPYHDVVDKHLNATQTQLVLGKSLIEHPDTVLNDYDIYDVNAWNPFHTKHFPRQVHSILTYVDTPIIDEGEGIWLAVIGMNKNGQAVYTTWLRPHYIYGKHQ